ncbi:MAG TPA: RsiV family protein [Gammaproteobacteria bacterium]|nr:RsiV family protein [Gammaproteobacteria bacterium]
MALFYQFLQHLKYTLILIVISCLFISLTFAEDDIDGDEDSGVERQQIYHIYNDVDLIPTTQLRYSKPKVVIKSVFPLLTSEEQSEHVEKFNQLVQAIIQEEIDDYKKRLADLLPLRKNLPESIANSESDLNIDFDSSIVNTHGSPIISVRFSVEGYIAGMAHPYHHHRVINFDLESAQPLELVDIFKSDSAYLDVLANYSNTTLLKRFKKSGDTVAKGTAPQLQNYKNWNVNPEGILITFDEYQVAPYYYGSQTVLVPYSTLMNLIVPYSPMGICLKHKNKCLRSHLLTGGFMNEAAAPHTASDLALL